MGIARNLKQQRLILFNAAEIKSYMDKKSTQSEYSQNWVHFVSFFAKNSRNAPQFQVTLLAMNLYDQEELH